MGQQPMTCGTHVALKNFYAAHHMTLVLANARRTTIFLLLKNTNINVYIHYLRLRANNFKKKERKRMKQRCCICRPTAIKCYYAIADSKVIHIL